MNKQDYLPRLNTSEDELQSITYMASQDWDAIAEQMVDTTSPIAVKYFDLLCWQICNSTFKSMDIYNSNANKFKNKWEESIRIQRQSTHGTEIAKNNFEDLELQGKTWKALHDLYKAKHQAFAKLYKTLYGIEFYQRKKKESSDGNVRTMKDMTPEEIKQITEISTKAFGW
jgi:hypothetical protein